MLRARAFQSSQGSCCGACRQVEGYWSRQQVLTSLAWGGSSGNGEKGSDEREVQEEELTGFGGPGG